MRHWENEKRIEPRAPANPEHLEIVRLGATAWQEWRDLNPEVTPILFDADLKGADLSGFDLRGARLDGADLTAAKLRRTRLEKASLDEAVLYEANLDEATLTGANLEDADLLMVTASKAKLRNVKARGARFAGAVIRDSQLFGSDLRDTDLREAEFHGSKLEKVRLEGAILWKTHFEEADLRGATGMRFDETIIRNTKFSPRSPDRWSTLRRHYTGPRYAITLILLIAFVLPYFAKATGWVAAARTQEAIGGALLEAEVRVAALEKSGAAGAPVASEVIRSIRDRLPVEGAQDWRSAQVWELLLGIDKGIWYFLATCVLLLYNLLRGLLTWVVGPMRDAEERSGVAPPHRVEGNNPREKLLRWLRGGWAESYAWLWLPHKVVTILFVVAVGSFLFNAVNWLALVVWLPA
jgi:hypothetical protein